MIFISQCSLLMVLYRERTSSQLALEGTVQGGEGGGEGAGMTDLNWHYPKVQLLTVPGSWEGSFHSPHQWHHLHPHCTSPHPRTLKLVFSSSHEEKVVTRMAWTCL